MYFYGITLLHIYILIAILINKVLPNNATAIGNKCPTTLRKQFIFMSIYLMTYP